MLIGNLFPEKIQDTLTGIVISIRREFNILKIWVRNSENVEEIRYLQIYLIIISNLVMK